MKRYRKRRKTKRTGAKRMHIAGRAYDTGHGESKATSKWQYVRITLEAASCWVHKDFIVTSKQIQALLTAAGASGRKDECQVRLTDIEQEYWMGTEIGRFGGYSFQGTVTAGGGSNQEGWEMGAGHVNP